MRIPVYLRIASHALDANPLRVRAVGSTNTPVLPLYDADGDALPTLVVKVTIDVADDLLALCEHVNLNGEDAIALKATAEPEEATR